MRTIVALLVLVAVPVASYAQTTDPANWPVCRLGAAPIAPGPAPAEATVFKTTGGPVIMSEAGLQGTVRLIRCRLAPGAEVYRGADGDLRDLPSNQPFWSVGWDASPTPLADAVKGLKGDIGPKGPQGPPGRDGIDGKDGRDYTRHIESHSHKGLWITAAILGGAATTVAIIAASHGSHATAVATVIIR